MKHFPLLIAFMALFGHLVLAQTERWEIFPLVPGADIATFNATEWGAWDPAVWRVVNLTVLSDGIADSFALGDECLKEGNTTGFCNIEQDLTKCNIAIRIPSLPRPAGQETRADSWVYTHDCSSIRGCKLLQNRDGDWWSIFSDLKYTVEVNTDKNNYPYFAYADYKCNGRWCLGWSYILDDPHKNGRSVYVYRHSFPCNQG
ncbi:hypothetical protein CONLIGDRAFT_641455 [Coniochaeta ligniaria NRRL 30616]|uniref:Uncharacterized protein n=1 Tax=Coniochaeta ligniaria NRRL 30616 TaxID=1408157 RepID=A0A1J7JV99_9PEZI|nr:hypothetical protein CONLIGDRAFT_641455 [Coniochaeta ligniaria NRRL 30616]